MLAPNIIPDIQRAHSRRWFMQECGVGLGALASASASASLEVRSQPNPLVPRVPHQETKVKNLSLHGRRTLSSRPI